MKFFVLCTLISTLITASQAATSSRACSFIGGVMRCTENNDPNGNSAVAYSGTNGPNGQVYAGQGYPAQGYPGNFNFAPFNGYPGGFQGFPFQQQFPYAGKRR